jgi:hypothetical protein
VSRYSSNWYILVATDYAINWVEVRALWINTTDVIAKFLYDHIFTRFSCPLIIVIDQGTHFINNVIHYLIDHFILRHPTLLSITHKGMDKLNILTKFLVHYSRNWWMRTRITRMNTFPQFYYFTKPLSRLEMVTLHFNLFMDYTHYYL